MIHGFEEHTARLTPEERKLAKKVIAQLEKCKGKDHAKKNKDLRFLLNNKSEENVQSARMRKIINYIRRSNKLPLLVASSKGYYISDDIVEIEMYLLSLKQRCSAIAAVERAVKEQCEKLKVEKKYIAENKTLRYKLRSTANMTKGKRYRLLWVRNNKYIVLNNTGRPAAYNKSSFSEIKSKIKHL